MEAEIKARVYRTAYARNGNAHNPTQYKVWDVYVDGRIWGTFPTLRKARAAVACEKMRLAGVPKGILVVLALLALAGPARASEVVSVVVTTQTVTAAPGANLTTRSGAGGHSSIGTWFSILPPGGRLVAWRVGVDPSFNDSSRVRVTCTLESGSAVSSPSSVPAPVFVPFADFAWTPGLPLRDAPASVPAGLVFVAGESTVWLSVHVRNGSAAPINASCKVFLFFEVS